MKFAFVLIGSLVGFIVAAVAVGWELWFIGWFYLGAVVFFTGRLSAPIPYRRRAA